MSKTLVIIPTYNEEENIARLVDTLFGLNLNLDILVVDDGNDGTANIIEERRKQIQNLFLIKRGSKGGRGKAVLEGIKFALEKNYGLIVEIDADFSHNPQELPTLLAVSGDNTLVIGSRYARGSKIVGWPLKRRVFSKLANFYANLVLGIGLSDYTNGYRVYGRKAAEKIDFDKVRSSGYIVLSEIAYQLFKKGVKFVEVPTIFINRRQGVSNFSLKEIKESFLSVIIIRIGQN